MSDDRVTQLGEVIPVLVNVIRTVHLKRELHAVCAEPKLNFWRVIYGNLLDVAVLDWCKMFGSDDAANQPTHWKNVAADREAFLVEMLCKLQLSKYEWCEYWAYMKKFRDRHVAHHDPRRIEMPNYPQLDHALTSSYFYYDYVRADLARLGVDKYPGEIRNYGQRFAGLCREAGALALTATSGIEETVN